MVNKEGKSLALASNNNRQYDTIEDTKTFTNNRPSCFTPDFPPDSYFSFSFKATSKQTS